MSKRKKVLITGANGFSGRHLAALLSGKRGRELFLADRTPPKGHGPQFHHCDFSDADAVRALLRDIRPDEVYHLVGSYTNEYTADYVSNILTAKHVLDALRSAHVHCRILLVGSSAEYGFPDNPTKGVPETHPLRPVSVYGLVKVCLTELMGLSVRLYDMNIVAVRPFNLIGRGISKTLFPGNMEEQIAQYKNGRRRTITTGDLSVERDYIDIDDAVQYYSLVMARGRTGEIYNIGSGTSASLRSLLSRMLQEAGLPMDIVREGQHQTSGKIVVPKIFANISKIHAL